MHIDFRFHEILITKSITTMIDSALAEAAMNRAPHLPQELREAKTLRMLEGIDAIARAMREAVAPAHVLPDVSSRRLR
jgi:hypothetical protein